MEKAIKQARTPRLFLLALAATTIAASSALSIPIQTVNAQDLSEYALLISSQCGGQVEVKNDKVECGTLEAKNDKLELPGCEIKEGKNECQ